MRRLYIWREGNFIEITPQREENAAPAVHQDTFEKPLKHPVTGEMVDSYTRWKQINKAHNLQEVGNDLLSKYPREIPDRLTDDRIKDAIEKAESIVSDPAKLNARRNYEALLRERNERLLNGRR